MNCRILAFLQFFFESVWSLFSFREDLKILRKRTSHAQFHMKEHVTGELKIFISLHISLNDSKQVSMFPQRQIKQNRVKKRENIFNTFSTNFQKIRKLSHTKKQNPDKPYLQEVEKSHKMRKSEVFASPILVGSIADSRGRPCKNSILLVFISRFYMEDFRSGAIRR